MNFYGHFWNTSVPNIVKLTFYFYIFKTFVERSLSNLSVINFFFVVIAALTCEFFGVVNFAEGQKGIWNAFHDDAISVAANLGGPSAGSNSGLPVSSGRSAGRLLGLVGRDNSGAFSEVATSNGTSTATSGTSSAGTQPQLERHQALRLPRRQTQVLSSAPSTFTSSNVSNGGVAGPSAASATVTSAPVTGLSTSSVPNNAAVAASAEAAGHPQLLLSRYTFNSFDYNCLFFFLICQTKVYFIVI